MSQLIELAPQPYAEWRAEEAGFKPLLSQDDEQTEGLYPLDITEDDGARHGELMRSLDIIHDTFIRIADTTGVGFEKFAKFPELCVGADYFDTTGIDPEPRMVVDATGKEYRAAHYGSMSICGTDGLDPGDRIVKVVLQPLVEVPGIERSWLVPDPQVFFFDAIKDAFALRVWKDRNILVRPLSPTWYDGLARFTGYTEKALAEDKFSIYARPENHDE